MIHVMLLTPETERGASWELEPGICYVFMIYLELVIPFGFNFIECCCIEC